VNAETQPKTVAADPDSEVARRRASVQRAAQRAQRAVMTILVMTCLLGVALVVASYRAYESQQQAERAEAQAQERSWHASLAQARAERLSSDAGHRAKALHAISNAAAIRPSVELRDEAIAAFALRDLEKEVSWPLKPGAFGFYFDPELEHYVVRYAPNENSMFRLRDNQLVRKFRAEDAGLPPTAVALGAIFSVTGRYLVVPYQSGELVLYDRHTAEAKHIFGKAGDERLAWRPTFTEDDGILCARSASRSNVVLFVNLESGERRELNAPGVNETLRMNQQGTAIVWNRQRELVLHDARTGARLNTIEWPANVLSLRWNAQGDTISVWCGDGTLNLLDVKSGRIRQLGGKLVGPWVQHFSPDGSMLATSGNDGTSRLWDVTDGQLLVQTTEARTFVWANDSERVAFAVPGREVGVWRITRPRGYQVFQSPTDLGTVWYQDLSPDGRWLVRSPFVAGTNASIELFSVSGHGAPISLPAKFRARAGFHPTQPRLVITGDRALLSYPLPEPGTNRALELTAPERIALPGDVSPQEFTFSADGQRLAVVDARARLLVVDLAQSNRVTFIQGTAPVIGQAGPGSVTGSGALAMSPDGRWIAMGRNPQSVGVTLWDTTTGKVARRFNTDHSHVAFSPDGRWLVAVGARQCTLWEVGTWKTVWSKPRAPLVELVGAAAFTANGSMLAYTHAVDRIEIVEPATAQHIASVAAPTPIEISGLRFSADGNTLVVAAGSGRMHTWDMRALRSDLAKLGLDWPLKEAPRVAKTSNNTPLIIGSAGAGAVLLAGVLGTVALRRHGRLAREFVQTTETAARLHESERAAQLALEQEKELSRLKSHFVTTVSHEFRTPLGVIMSSAENLRDYHERFTPVQREEHLRDIFDASRTMSGLMEEVLLLGRVDAGKVTFRPAPLDLRALAERLIEEVRSATNDRCPIEFHFTPSERAPRGDEGLLRHIFVNLLTNAVKYSPAGRPVALRIEPQDSFALITIRDHGIGVPAEDLPHLFDAFHRGRNVGDVPGSGLGMVIVKRCVDLHGGTIHCESREGEGSTFTVRLPLFLKLA
jgi:signal transduction histidine kinase